MAVLRKLRRVIEDDDDHTQGGSLLLLLSCLLLLFLLFAPGGWWFLLLSRSAGCCKQTRPAGMRMAAMLSHFPSRPLAAAPLLSPGRNYRQRISATWSALA